MKRSQPVNIGLLKGLNYNLHPTLLEGGESPNLKHLRFHKGVLKKDMGFKDFGNQMDLQTMWFDQFFLTTGSSFLFAFTLDRSYKYNSGTSQWDDITKAGPIEWTGDQDNLFAGAVFNDEYFISNGKDTAQKGVGGNFADITTIAGHAIPKSWSVFYEYLLMLNTIENGTAYPQRVRWCDTDDATDWTSGNAGYLDLDDESDFIMGGMMLLGRTIVYKERTIYELTYTGSPDIFIAAPLVSGVGVQAYNTLVSMGDYHLFLGPDDIYRFDGRTPEALGDQKLVDYLFGPSGVVNTENITRAWGAFIEERGEYWLGIPTTESTPDTIVKYNFNRREFTKREAAVTAVGFYTRGTGLTWNDLTPAPEHAWENLSWHWNDRTLSAGAPTTILGDTSGYTYEDDGLTTADDGVEQEVLFETMDFTFSDSTKITNFSFDTRGSGILYLSYSVDEGTSYSAETAFTLTSKFSSQDYNLNLTIETIRWKFRTSAINFEMKGFKPWFIPRVRGVV